MKLYRVDSIGRKKNSDSRISICYFQNSDFWISEAIHYRKNCYFQNVGSCDETLKKKKKKDTFWPLATVTRDGNVHIFHYS